MLLVSTTCDSGWVASTPHNGDLTVGQWNDTDIPLAHLITFRCRGTWLHGDARGSIDRFRSQYRSPYIPPNDKWLRYNTAALKGPPVTFNASQRNSVENAITEACEKRFWILRAFNVRTNHVHTVVSIGITKPELALNAFKANATRHMRADGNWNEERSPWADKGGKRNLFECEECRTGNRLCMNGQGDELPDFDD